ncbi:conjugal transfer protein MobB [Epilithonimonas pallida]|uniref:Relaxase/Mobilisation nuclease domain-containing protein n=1 Tax=Epilithonimonas pallida TaxID=373671 RepID=A0ABY1R056_9FLAO|nr:conjugal transfer protein MobB [Epilithonimonas pallida]SMP88248.1 Relaxase/Mobilisation nuclease domain-containing protein [Epilithonimonas pallida]
MIAKIGRSSNLFGTLSYNNSKMEKDKGEILLTNKMIETADGKYSVAQLSRSFEPYLLANRNTEKHTLHISLNPDPKDNVSNEKYRLMALQYMQDMGYGEQPFVVFKHTDIDRSHIHIVSVCVDEDGKKISDKFEKVRSMKVSRKLEEQFGLISAIEKENKLKSEIFKAVDYKRGDVKSQIASVVRNITSQYQFQSLSEYNALLSLYNIAAEKVEGEMNGYLQRGLMYFPTDRNGKKTGNPFKASLFGKKAGLDSLEKHFESFKAKMKSLSERDKLKEKILLALQSSNDEKSFTKKLQKEGIDIMIRKNDVGRIYGITFIDHRSKTVWNGSRLGKECSANAFNELWNNNLKPDEKGTEQTNKKSCSSNDTNFPEPILDRFFDMMDTESAKDLLEAVGGLLPSAQEEDYEEIDFEKRMRRKKKRLRKK